MSILDINAAKGLQLTERLNKEHGSGRVMFILCDVTSKSQMEGMIMVIVLVLVIDCFHVTSLLPCRRTITKDLSSASIVSSSNMAATSLSLDCQGVDCKPSMVMVM